MSGKRRTDSPPDDALPVAYQLQHYRIERVLSAGLNAFVYLAQGAGSQRFALKEYFPAQIAQRGEAHQVVGGSGERGALFRAGLKSFLSEAHTLSEIAQPNVVGVVELIRANGTAYLVMPHVAGKTLHHHIDTHRERLNERFVRHLFFHLLSGLREIHVRKLLHLDLNPASILVAKGATPILLNLGFATCAGAQEWDFPGQSPTDGFAAPEQYQGAAELGPWTDLFAVGVTMFCCVAGFAWPQEEFGTSLWENSGGAAGAAFSGQLMETIDWCVQFDPAERPQSAWALQKALLAGR